MEPLRFEAGQQVYIEVLQGEPEACGYIPEECEQWGKSCSECPKEGYYNES